MLIQIISFLLLSIIAFIASFYLTKVNFDVNLKEPILKNTISIREKQFQLSALTMDKIFQSDHTWVGTLSAQKKIVILATGDVIPARAVNFQVIARNNFKWPYEKTAEILKSADLTFINLESPLMPNCPVTQEGMVFCGDVRNLEGLKFAGADVANLANNHAGNHGQAGLENTANLLADADIKASGLLGPVFRDLKGSKVVFLGYNDLDHGNAGLQSEYAKKIQSDIALAKKSADIVVVAFHWGIEYTSQPSQRQRNLAHLAIDSGGDLIIGNHPHWIQPVEIYHNKIITYAHGNFIFDQMWSVKTREGVVGKYTFFDKKLIDVEFIPIKIENYGQPYFLEGSEKQRILDEMKNNSLKL